MSWYYVDSAGATKGPLTEQQLKQLYGNEVKDNTYIWLFLVCFNNIKYVGPAYHTNFISTKTSKNIYLNL